jgi:hypothetical protein
MISFSIILSLTLLPFVIAQSSDPALQIEAIEAHFTASGIVPSLLSTFDPSAILTLNYAGTGDISPGQALKKDQVGPIPSVTVTAANSSVELSAKFTLAMVDAGPVGSDQSKGVTRHWLVNGVTVSSSKVSNATATAITEYAGPAPPSGSGPHRYVVILYAQPSTFTPPKAFSEPNIGVSVFDVNAYAKDSGLGAVIAATYITVEEGTATVSLSATSAVVTSTLASVTSSSGNLSGTSSTAKPTGTSPNSGSGLKAGNVGFFIILTALIILVA